jgi:hypothetical protein
MDQPPSASSGLSEPAESLYTSHEESLLLDAAARSGTAGDEAPGPLDEEEDVSLYDGASLEWS